jgi:hypothetical protein
LEEQTILRSRAVSAAEDQLSEAKKRASMTDFDIDQADDENASTRSRGPSGHRLVGLASPRGKRHRPGPNSKEWRDMKAKELREVAKKKEALKELEELEAAREFESRALRRRRALEALEREEKQKNKKKNKKKVGKVKLPELKRAEQWKPRLREVGKLDLTQYNKKFSKKKKGGHIRSWQRAESVEPEVERIRRARRESMVQALQRRKMRQHWNSARDMIQAGTMHTFAEKDEDEQHAGRSRARATSSYDDEVEFRVEEMRQVIASRKARRHWFAATDLVDLLSDGINGRISPKENVDDE